MPEYIIAQFVLHRQGIVYTRRSAKAMHPAQPGQTQTASARLPELFMDVAFLAPKSPKLQVFPLAALRLRPGQFRRAVPGLLLLRLLVGGARTACRLHPGEIPGFPALRILS